MHKLRELELVNLFTPATVSKVVNTKADNTGLAVQ